jgi:hypothetical protein
VRQHVQDAVDQARAASGNLLGVPPVLHGPPEADRHRRARRPVHKKFGAQTVEQRKTAAKAAKAAAAKKAPKAANAATA